MNKNILIASYYFPPYPGIGGRRMAKFCKYLVQKGYTVHVIKVEDHHDENSYWLNDIDHPGIKVYPLPVHYPKILRMNPGANKAKQTLFNRLRYKLTYLFYTAIQKKRVYDLTFLWEKQFINLAEKLIRELSITNFIVSVSPHYYAFYASQLKKTFPDLNLIIDFRDPWLILRDFGLQSMNAKQEKNEKRMVAEVARAANYLISPSRLALDELKPYVNDTTKFIEITHAFDWDDVKKYIKTEGLLSETNTGKIKFIYPGTLYTDILPSLLKLNEVLTYLKVNASKVYSKLEFNFYADQQHYSSYFSQHEMVHFHKPIGKQIFEEIKGSTVILILYAEHNKNYRTTKFYEFLPFQKNYLYIGPHGDTYEFIKKYQLGDSFSETADTKVIAAYFEQAINGLTYKPLINFNNYSFDKQTDALISLFK